MVSLTFVATIQRAPLGLTQGPVKFSHEFYWPIGHSHTTAAVRPGREENAEETSKMKINRTYINTQGRPTGRHRRMVKSSCLLSSDNFIYEIRGLSTNTTDNFGSWWVATVAIRCPGRMAEHPKSMSTGGYYYSSVSPCISIHRHLVCFLYGPSSIWHHFYYYTV